jgi:hypothetical protein
MKRLLRSSVLLAACVGLWSCTNDPTGDLGGKPTKLAATPSSLFITQDSTKLVDVELLDEQGAAIPASFSVASQDPGVTVTADDEFRPEYNAEGVLFVPDEVTKLRLNVTGVSATSTTVNVSAGRVTLEIPVRVVPTNFDAAVSDAAPDGGESIILTAPAGFAFLADAGVTFETGGDALVLSNTGTDLTILPVPGSTGTATVSNVEVAFLAGTPLSLPLVTSITVGSTVAALAGTDDPATAPTIDLPAAGGVTAFYDAGTFPGTFPAGDCELFGDGDFYRCQIYRIDVATAGDLTFTGKWSNTADLGIYIADDTFTFTGDSCDAHGNGATSQPEECTVTFATPGTYYVAMATFAEFYPDPDPDWFTIEIRAP